MKSKTMDKMKLWAGLCSNSCSGEIQERHKPRRVQDEDSLWNVLIILHTLKLFLKVNESADTLRINSKVTNTLCCYCVVPISHWQLIEPHDILVSYVDHFNDNQSTAFLTKVTNFSPLFEGRA